ncbi:hypothetical protein GCM10009753_72000 [Streptantibioticus ferralitis]
MELIVPTAETDFRVARAIKADSGHRQVPWDGSLWRSGSGQGAWRSVLRPAAETLPTVDRDVRAVLYA